MNPRGKFNVVFLSGNITKFDVTPIHIYARLTDLQSNLDNPVLFGLVDTRTFLDVRKGKSVVERFSSIGVKLHLFPRIPVISAIVIAAIVLGRRAKVVHAMGYHASMVGVVVKMLTGCRLVFESHGAAPEEMVFRGLWRQGGLKFRIAKLFERYLFKFSDHIIVVSHAYRRLVEQNYGASDVSVASCAVSLKAFPPKEDRSRARRLFNVANRFVLAYNGSFFENWGDPFENIRVFNLLKQLGENPFLLVLTVSPKSEVVQYLTSYRIPASDFAVLNLSHERVMDLLVGGDLGLLLRKPSMVNQVASPMKFPEYLSCGVPVLASEGIGDISEYIEIEKLGVVFGGRSSENTLRLQKYLEAWRRGNIGAIRRRCIGFARRYLTYESQRDIYIQLYEQLSHKHFG